MSVFGNRYGATPLQQQPGWCFSPWLRDRRPTHNRPPTTYPSSQEIFLLRLSALGSGNHPAGHAPTTGPSVFRVFGITILNGDSPLPLPATLAEKVLKVKAV